MVEGDFNAVEILYPGHGLGVVSGFGFLVFCTNEKGDGTGVAAGVAVRFGIDADQTQRLGVDARFFHQLALGCVLHSLSDFDETSRQSVFPLEGRIFPANHKHTAGGIDNDAIDGEQRSFRRRHDNSIYVERAEVKTPGSAGLLLYRRQQDLEVLLAHPGGPYWRNKDDGAWTVPKGEIHGEEDPYATALREFEEETGLRPHGKTLSLGSLRQSDGKLVHVWAVENDWDPAFLISNQFSIEWPPRSGRTATFPEIDRANWFDLATARRKILKSQMDFLNRLEAALDVGAA